MTARKTVVALVLLAGVVYLFPRAQWRARLLAWKLQGDLPFLTWTDVSRELTPFRFGVQRIGMEGLERVLSGPVRFQESGEPPCPVEWRSPLGDFWGRAADGPLLDYLIQEQLADRVYERDPVVVQKNDVVLDAGAHLGTFTRYALGRGARLVVAFEPHPVNAACFRRSFQSEIAEGRVVLVEAALWESSGSLRFQDNGFNSAAGSAVAAADVIREIEVRSTTIDETAEQLRLEKVDFIKMDIEGAERYALKGGRETIVRFGPRMVVCTYHVHDDLAAVREAALRIRPGYQVFTSATHAYFY